MNMNEELDLPQKSHRSRLNTDRWNLNPGTVIVLIVLLLALATFACSKFLFAPKLPSAEASVVGGQDGDEAPQSSLEEPAEMVLVYVSGEVGAPGVYELQLGARVKDALDAASGASAEADLDSVNLARQVVDGEQIHIGNVAAMSAPSAANGPQNAGQNGMQCIDINRADAFALESLNGIGPALAQRIVDHRDQVGSFSGKEALMEVSGIGPKVYAGLENDLCG